MHRINNGWIVVVVVIIIVVFDVIVRVYCLAPALFHNRRAKHIKIIYSKAFHCTFHNKRKLEIHLDVYLCMYIQYALSLSCSSFSFGQFRNNTIWNLGMRFVNKNQYKWPTLMQFDCEWNGRPMQTNKTRMSPLAVEKKKDLWILQSHLISPNLRTFRFHSSNGRTGGKGSNVDELVNNKMWATYVNPE